MLAGPTVSSLADGTAAGLVILTRAGPDCYLRFVSIRMTPFVPLDP